MAVNLVKYIVVYREILAYILTYKSFMPVIIRINSGVVPDKLNI